jgi:hypothetical protein
MVILFGEKNRVQERGFLDALCTIDSTQLDQRAGGSPWVPGGCCLEAERVVVAAPYDEETEGLSDVGAVFPIVSHRLAGNPRQIEANDEDPNAEWKQQSLDLSGVSPGPGYA